MEDGIAKYGSVGPPTTAPVQLHQPNAVPPLPAVAAGWYPDPSQPATQRYWDGHAWTIQTAPLAAHPAETGHVDYDPMPMYLGLAGAAVAIVGCFLPAASSSEVLVILNNSLINSQSGLIIVGVAIVAGLMAYLGRATPGQNLGQSLIGLLVGGFAYLGVNGLEAKNALGQSVDVSPAVGIYVVGIGALILVIAGGSSRDPR